MQIWRLASASERTKPHRTGEACKSFWPSRSWIAILSSIETSMSKRSCLMLALFRRASHFWWESVQLQRVKLALSGIACLIERKSWSEPLHRLRERALKLRSQRKLKTRRQLHSLLSRTTTLKSRCISLFCSSMAVTALDWLAKTYTLMKAKTLARGDMRRTQASTWVAYSDQLQLSATRNTSSRFQRSLKADSLPQRRTQALINHRGSLKSPIERLSKSQIKADSPIDSTTDR